MNVARTDAVSRIMMGPLDSQVSAGIERASRIGEPQNDDSCGPRLSLFQVPATMFVPVGVAAKGRKSLSGRPEHDTCTPSPATPNWAF